jgi:tartrate dehydrogenase/decarboxylase/D-malate dehydrogenase
VRGYGVAVIPGDGVGPEVVGAACRVLDRAGELWGFELRWEIFDWGCGRYLRTGRVMPRDGLDRLRGCDAIFLGPVGHPTVPDRIPLEGLLIPIRRGFEQYVDLRPARLFDGVRSPIRNVRGGEIDFVVVRENSEGECSEVGGRLHRGTLREMAVQEAVFSRPGLERIMRYAFELARERGGELASAVAVDGITHTMPLWDEVFSGLAEEYPDVRTVRHSAEELAALFVLRPQQFDVVVASSLLGGILADLGAAVSGSGGMAPSASLNPGREHPSMFGPRHGPVPEAAGRGTANPLGQVWSGAMMLEHLGEREACEGIMAALQRVLPHTEGLTPDLGGSARTAQVANALMGALEC